MRWEGTLGEVQVTGNPRMPRLAVRGPQWTIAITFRIATVAAYQAMYNTTPMMLAVLLWGGGAVLSAAPTAEDLVKQHLSAIGGVDAAHRIKTRRSKGSIEIPMQGISGEMTIWSKAPNKQRVEIDLAGMGKVIEGYDGRTGWSQNPWIGLIEKSAAQVKQAAEQADFYRDVALLSRYESWTLRGKESVTGRTVDVVEGRTREGKVDVYYLDEQTHLLLQLKTEAATEQGPMVVVTKFGDHREVGGVKLPFLVDVEAGPGGFKMIFKEITHGIEMPDTLFAKPKQ